MVKWVLSLLFIFPLFSEEIYFPTNPKIKAKFSSIDPRNVSQNFAFYELYPETREGKLALARAWRLLSPENPILNSHILPKIDPWPLINVINREDSEIILQEKDLYFIESLAKHLKNRELKGYKVWKKEEVLALDPHEIDLCRGLFLEQYGDEEEVFHKIRTYEAMIDLMALQILARLSENATAKEKIHAINTFVFHEMGFRFPPHSLWAKDIDEYTFLPTVIDSRKGVCLGVSILYLCIAQRMGIELEAITPPGHIYVRYIEEDGDHLNIETTARGINIPSEMYMGVETRKLQRRNLREVIGLAFINQASVSWMREEYEKAVFLYEKAVPYMPDDFLLKELLAYNYLFVGNTKEGSRLLREVQDKIPDFAVSRDTIAKDYLEKKTDAEGIKAIFLPVDETRASILKKQEKLHEVIKKYPLFRAGLLQLAGTYLQLGREKEALRILEKYQKIDPTDPVVNYYLAVLSFDRFDFNRSWKYLQSSEELVKMRSHDPKALREFRKVLTRTCPEPILSS